ncbi:cupin domain-containing protein [Natronomonas marina]|uniref:cupin domain-containing protein n=1 Tax=Natronomonas marina TaxID=2961939 RepID=UPI0020C95167|nr:cupin domain-containing protein [Natronomonas marina]
MTFDELPEVDPAPGEVETAELVVHDDVLVKLFALGPGGAFEPHVHEDSTNVFHLLEGEVVVSQDGSEETLSAPAVVHNARGVEHGARNDGDERALLTASLCPLP